MEVWSRNIWKYLEQLTFPESADLIFNLHHVRREKGTRLLNTCYIWGTMLSPCPILKLDEKSPEPREGRNGINILFWNPEKHGIKYCNMSLPFLGPIYRFIFLWVENISFNFQKNEFSVKVLRYLNPLYLVKYLYHNLRDTGLSRQKWKITGVKIFNKKLPRELPHLLWVPLTLQLTWQPFLVLGWWDVSTHGSNWEPQLQVVTAARSPCFVLLFPE